MSVALFYSVVCRRVLLILGAPLTLQLYDSYENPDICVPFENQPELKIRSTERNDGGTCGFSERFSRSADTHMSRTAVRFTTKTRRSDIERRSAARVSSRKGQSDGRNGQSVTIRNYEKYSEFYDAASLRMPARLAPSLPPSRSLRVPALR